MYIYIYIFIYVERRNHTMCRTASDIGLQNSLYICCITLNSGLDISEALLFVKLRMDLI